MNKIMDENELACSKCFNKNPESYRCINDANRKSKVADKSSMLTYDWMKHN